MQAKSAIPADQKNKNGKQLAYSLESLLQELNLSGSQKNKPKKPEKLPKISKPIKNEPQDVFFLDENFEIPDAGIFSENQTSEYEEEDTYRKPTSFLSQSRNRFTEEIGRTQNAQTRQGTPPIAIPVRSSLKNLSSYDDDIWPPISPER